MKKTVVSFFTVILLFFFASVMQAQNQSANNSEVIIANEWLFMSGLWIDCPSTGIITCDVDLRILTKTTPSGKWSHFLVANGEGFDEDGGKWIMHDAWNQSSNGVGDWHGTRTWTYHGPHGAKLQLKGQYIVKNGETIQYKVDPLCE